MPVEIQTGHKLSPPITYEQQYGQYPTSTIIKIVVAASIINIQLVYPLDERVQETENTCLGLGRQTLYT